MLYIWDQGLCQRNRPRRSAAKRRLSVEFPESRSQFRSVCAAGFL